MQTPGGRWSSGSPIGLRLTEALRDLRVAWYLAGMSLRREFFGLSLGRIWLVLEPALQAWTYYILLKYIFSLSGASVSFATFFSAVTFWRSHASMCASSANLIVESTRYAGSDISLRVPYLEFLFSELISFGFRFAVLILFLRVSGYLLDVSHVYLLFIAMVQFAFSMSLSVWISVLGGFFRDTGRFVGHIVWLWWFFSPGLYTIGQVPEDIRWVYDLNPFAYIMPAIVDAAVNGKVSHFGPLVWLLLGSLVAIIPGAWLAGRTKHHILFRV
ncbi:ABC transporter permease [Phenylobacterium terrae]|uniref:ABC transporter permease n=1 Tax=Phenylobacterium terrae TaxID=2665495 RepID=A0ABW4N446_9CAUL